MYATVSGHISDGCFTSPDRASRRRRTNAEAGCVSKTVLSKAGQRHTGYGTILDFRETMVASVSKIEVGGVPSGLV